MGQECELGEWTAAGPKEESARLAALGPLAAGAESPMRSPAEVSARLGVRPASQGSGQKM